MECVYCGEIKAMNPGSLPALLCSVGQITPHRGVVKVHEGLQSALLMKNASEVSSSLSSPRCCETRDMIVAIVGSRCGGLQHFREMVSLGR